MIFLINYRLAQSSFSTINSRKRLTVSYECGNKNQQNQELSLHSSSSCVCRLHPIGEIHFQMTGTKRFYFILESMSAPLESACGM